MNVFHLIAVSVKKLGYSEERCKKVFKGIVKRLKGREVESMLTDIKDGELLGENYYSMAISENKRYPTMLVVENKLVTLDASNLTPISEDNSSTSGLLGVVYYKDILIRIHRDPQIDFCSPDLKLIWSVTSVRPLSRILAWFNFSECYQVSRYGKFYMINNANKLMMADLNMIDELRHLVVSPFMFVSKDVINLTLSHNHKDVIYLKNNKQCLQVWKNQVKIFDLEQKINANSRAATVAASGRYLLITTRQIDNPVIHQLWTTKAKKLDQIDMELDMLSKKSRDVKNVTGFIKHNLSFFLVTCFWTHAYLLAVFRGKVCIVKHHFATGEIDGDEEKITNNCTLVRHHGKMTEFVFVGYKRSVFSMKF